MSEEEKKPLATETPAVENPEKEEGAEKSEDGGKTFSQAELERILADRLKREKESNAKELADAVQKALEEEKRMSGLKAEEREKELIEKQKRENAEKERELTLKGNTFTAIDSLTSLGIVVEKAKNIAPFLVKENIEEQEKNVSAFIDLYNEAVKIGVETKMSGQPPKDVLPNNSKPVVDIKPATFI